jgi:hypothetical protein
MFYFRFTADTPYCGTEATDYRIFKERPTDAELDAMAADFGQMNAESYEYLVTGWLEDEDEFDEEALENYYAECYSGWEEITKEEYEEER